MALNITPQSLFSNAATVTNLLTRSTNIDVNAVLNQQTLKQVFKDARPVRASIRETSQVMRYPVETGAVLSDHKIINPNEIIMLFTINSDFYYSAYQEIRTLWLNATLLSVQSRTGTYKNMIIESMPHEEEPDTFNMITIEVRFVEVIFVVPSSTSQPSTLANFSPANPAKSSMVNRGLLTALTSVGSGLSYFKALSVWGL